MADGTTISADILIYATGFRTNDFLYPIQVFGKEGVHINDTWQYGAEAYLGISVPGFPNFFMLYGPNTNLGHNSIVFMIENQVNYILNLIEYSLKNNHKTIEVSNSAMADWSEGVSMLWVSPYGFRVATVGIKMKMAKSSITGPILL